jgi:hypothetical protein
MASKVFNWNDLPSEKKTFKKMPHISHRFSSEFAALICPRCGDTYLHQEEHAIWIPDPPDSYNRVNMFTVVRCNRRNGTKITREKCSFSERDAITIDFSCENCNAQEIIATLRLYNSKGMTKMEWAFNTFDKWWERTLQIAEKNNYPVGDMEAEEWRHYFDLNYSPEEALELERSKL